MYIYIYIYMYINPYTYICIHIVEDFSIISFLVLVELVYDYCLFTAA